MNNQCEQIEREAWIGNVLVLYQAISGAFSDNFSPSVSVKADILTSSSEVDCFTSCGFPGHM